MKPLFDAVRDLVSHRVAVAAIAVSAAGSAGIIVHEGMINRVYLDPIGIPTVCAGHTKTVTRADLGKVFSPARCQELLRQDLHDAEQAVKRSVKVPITQAQYDALVSFTFNVGGGALHKSTLVRKLNAGDCWGAGAEFARWTMAGGKHLRGLEIRRADERAAFETGCK